MKDHINLVRNVHENNINVMSPEDSIPTETDRRSLRGVHNYDLISYIPGHISYQSKLCIFF